MIKFGKWMVKLMAIMAIGLLSACMEYHGRVVDAGGIPISGAKLHVTDVMGSEWSTYTNKDGYYFIDNLSDYGHDIFASKEGYITQVYDSQINLFPEINFVMLSDASDLVQSEVANREEVELIDVPVTGQVELSSVIDGA
ncbi:MAG: carboxypeptidase-like regulatory domain-containing protein [Pseudomonadales bacterium]|nr:carboxypeptidase-like regulatory domain-containing protein [Pseudomonadales bacterium]